MAYGALAAGGAASLGSNMVYVNKQRLSRKTASPLQAAGAVARQYAGGKRSGGVAAKAARRRKAAGALRL